MTVKNNLAFGLRRRGIDKAAIEKRVGEVAEMLGLSELLKRKPYALSGGQRQRVALGRAIVRDPKVFLFDEPLSNLDAALRVSTRNELIKLHQRLGATMIYVTHDQVEARTMGQRICIMNQGKVVQVGAPLEVYRNPADTFVAKFLGNPPMNLLNGELIQHDGRLQIRCAGQLLPLPDQMTTSLKPYLSGSVIAGIRPEDLYETVPANIGENTARLPGQVVTVEPLGAETLLTLQLDDSDQEIIARVGRDSAARVGDRLYVVADLGALHLFDGQTGRAITD
jgi:multiple sugar transport system ATP-binding protein